jgi:hypothetical protein
MTTTQADSRAGPFGLRRATAEDGYRRIYMEKPLTS